MNFDFDKYLGAYPLEKLESWKEVSNYINQRTLERLYVFILKINFLIYVIRIYIQPFSKSKMNIQIRRTKKMAKRQNFQK